MRPDAELFRSFTIPESRSRFFLSVVVSQAAQKGLATDGDGCTRIKKKGLIRIHPCESVAQIGFFGILPDGRWLITENFL
jgi:hypothetical protein